MRVRVLNPNSNAAVTAGVAAAVAAFAVPGRVEIRCETLAEGPFGIETAEDIARVAPRVLDRLRRDPADAEVIACYSDPGLAACRAALGRPVFGIGASAVAAALARVDRFGVIALSPASIRRHLTMLRAFGALDRLAGERAADLSVAGAAGAAAVERLFEAGLALRDQDGAEAVILGCAGMAAHRPGLEARLGIPVIDPCQAAVGLAVATLLA